MVRNKAKTIVLQYGSEEGLPWRLTLDIVEKTKKFVGSFTVASEERRTKNLLRSKDREFFRRRLSTPTYNKYEIDHDWSNGGRVTLKTPIEHRNCRYGKPNQRDWVKEEEWLQEK